MLLFYPVSTRSYLTATINIEVLLNLHKAGNTESKIVTEYSSYLATVIFTTVFYHRCVGPNKLVME